MAEIQHMVRRQTRHRPLFVWSGVGEGDTFQVLEGSGVQADIFLTVSGTFGGATVVLEGSLDGEDWFSAVDTSGTAISITSASHVVIRDSWPFFRISASGGSSQSLVAKISMADVR